LLKVLREANPDFALLDGTSAECDKVGHAWQGADPWLTIGIKRRPLQGLTLTEKAFNRALTAAQAPVERGVARLKSWRTFRRSQWSPNLAAVRGRICPGLAVGNAAARLGRGTGITHEHEKRHREQRERRPSGGSSRAELASRLPGHRPAGHE
jgi:hypothetical protein